MEKVYKSKVGGWSVAVCIGVAAVFVWSVWLCFGSTLVLLIDVAMTGGCMLCVLDVLLHTDYTIRSEKLIIRCGVFYRIVVPVSDIIEIAHRSTMLSSPALSAERIGIRYGRRRWVYVSPRDTDGFIADLKSLNADISVG